eukprot:3080739-Pleurochrysis_carterae.AAC.3
MTSYDKRASFCRASHDARLRPEAAKAVLADRFPLARTCSSPNLTQRVVSSIIAKCVPVALVMRQPVQAAMRQSLVYRNVQAAARTFRTRPVARTAALNRAHVCGHPLARLRTSERTRARSLRVASDAAASVFAALTAPSKSFRRLPRPQDEKRPGKVRPLQG